MKGMLSPFAMFLLFLGLVSPTARGAEKIRVLIVTGGHGFQTSQFFAIFQENQEITFQSVEHPKAHEWLKPENASRYDVLVFYDLWQNITEEAKADLVNHLKEGKGLVALHHCLVSYQKWDEYAEIIGGKYHLEKHIENGVKKPPSTFKPDVDFKVRVADPQHPVTQGLRDFAIHDETYGGFEVKPGVHPLLATDEPSSGPTVAWAKQYEKARIVYIQLGHDHRAYENLNYRRLIAQAIRWTAKRP